MKFACDYKISWILILPVFLVLSLVTSLEHANGAVQDEGIDRGMHDKLVEPAIPDEALRSVDKFWEEEDRFILIGNVQAYGSYSELEGDDQWGGSFYGLVAPGYKIGDRSMFILMYDGQYDKRIELYTEDYELERRTEFQRHAVTPMLRMDFGENLRYSITPSAFYTWTWNKDEGQDNSWDSGLYNYRDAGVGLDFDMRDVYGEYGSMKVSLQYYKRRYPNYQTTLYYIPSGGGLGVSTRTDDKDYHGPLVKVGYYWIKDEGFSWLSEYSLLYKRYDDKKITESSGALSPSTKQRDYVHEFDFNLWYFFGDIAGGLNVGLDINARINDSNENYLFSNGVVPIYINEDFYDYRSYRIGPNIAYMFEMIPLTASFTYSYEYLDYTDRRARNDDPIGSPKSDEQWESTHDVTVGLKFDYTEKVSFLAQWEHTKGRSNNDFVAAYEYDYRVNYYLLGAKYEF